MDVKPGDIYWVDIPPSHTIGSEQYDRRPYVIVSRLLVNRSGNTVVGVPLSAIKDESKNGNQPPYRINIPAREIIPDVSFKGEVRASTAKTDHVRVLDKRRLLNKMGRLSDTALVAVGLGLAFLLDIR
jgi:mRNA-degrading endonuclease toxin of MazEF toxin-antitoxin module